MLKPNRFFVVAVDDKYLRVNRYAPPTVKDLTTYDWVPNSDLCTRFVGPGTLGLLDAQRWLNHLLKTCQGVILHVTIREVAA